MQFQQWLTNQKEREDQIGRLARDMDEIDAKKYPASQRRKADEHRQWASIVTRFGSPAHVRSFNQAWQEFLQAKQRAEQQENRLS